MRHFVTLFVFSTIFYSNLALAEQQDVVSCGVYLKKQEKRSTIILENSYPQSIKVDNEKTLELSYGGNSIALKLTRPPTSEELEAFRKKHGRNEVGLGPIKIAGATTSFDGGLIGASLSSEDVYVDCNK